MKKLILSLLPLAFLAFAANAITEMCVEKNDGTIVRYDVEHVTELYYEKVSHDQGVTVSGTVDNYTFVDLGLRSGVLWATYNVGATKPTEYGDYFAWGETSPKKDYNSTNYKWLLDGSLYTKYCTNRDEGKVDNKKVLDAEDDAATANWGSAWRMPTVEEINELKNGCEWKWVKDFSGSGVNGRLGTSKKNGATIFLPAAGYRYYTDLGFAGDYGNYWSSSLREDDSSRAFCLDFSDGRFDLSYYSLRLCGQSVRAVLR